MTVLDHNINKDTLDKELSGVSGPMAELIRTSLNLTHLMATKQKAEEEKKPAGKAEEKKDEQMEQNREAEDQAKRAKVAGGPPALEGATVST